MQRNWKIEKIWGVSLKCVDCIIRNIESMWTFGNYLTLVRFTASHILKSLPEACQTQARANLLYTMTQWCIPMIVLQKKVTTARLHETQRGRCGGGAISASIFIEKVSLYLTTATFFQYCHCHFWAHSSRGVGERSYRWSDAVGEL